MKALLLALAMGLSGAVCAADASYTATDHRIPIEVTARERNQILYEMREFLHGLFNINHALSRGDMKAVSVEAQPMAQMMTRLPGAVNDRFPEGFMQMGLAMHEAFGQLGKLADSQAGMPAMQGQMAEILSYCSGCHDTYRFDVVAYKAGKRPSVDKVNPYVPK